LYDRLFVRPFLYIARPGRRDGLDRTMALLPATVRSLNSLVVLPQTGRLRWYVASMAIGAVLVLCTVMLTLH
ncbi:MAG: NADH-quinone oxidoreductase subunit L, partial [Gammaproteobacteria bacterium]